ncbi:MAG: PIN domain-containing protein [Clostridiales Family XIII bacterium]|jgi:predicted nucleic acid-binding protein|nr:PIN domain-containing protein [Clostridiales Family XIII bacterium]
MIIDTDVLIWYFRGSEKARTIIEAALPFSISAITIMELLQGAKNKAEQNAINKQLRVWNADVIHLNESASIRAVQFVSDFALSHSMVAMDALIAAAAVEHNSEFLTANTKHFEHIPGLKMQKFQPE